MTTRSIYNVPRNLDQFDHLRVVGQLLKLGHKILENFEGE